MAPTEESKEGEHKGISFWRFVEKTIAYLILLVLALLGFGGTFVFCFDKSLLDVVIFKYLFRNGFGEFLEFPFLLSRIVV